MSPIISPALSENASGLRPLRPFPPPVHRRPSRRARTSRRRHGEATAPGLEPAAREHQRAGRLGRPAAPGAVPRTGRHQRLRRRCLRGLCRELVRGWLQAVLAHRRSMSRSNFVDVTGSLTASKGARFFERLPDTFVTRLPPSLLGDLGAGASPFDLSPAKK